MFPVCHGVKDKREVLGHIPPLLFVLILRYTRLKLSSMVAKSKMLSSVRIR